MKGIDANTGKSLEDIGHLRQSVQDILTTRVGTRVMRRDYGSNVPAIVDSPMNDGYVVRVIAESRRALARWEPRIKVKRVIVGNITDNGRSTVDIEAILVSNGKPITLEGIVL